MAFQEALNCMSKLAGALLFWFTGNQHGPRTPTQVKHITSTRHNLTGFRFSFRSKGESSSPVVSGNISIFMMRLLCGEAEGLQSFSILSLAATLVPPFKNLEDTGMTVRLVINCNGMKINAVKNAFEKSLRARLLKTNPDTDYSCMREFGSFFTKDIPLPVGTTVDFLGGKQIGAVHSKELCRAFFDMYIGDIPVSEETKEEIGNNVALIIRNC
ncbi:hypothetical protein P3X46_019708 [Hevea brasiliensis]|uniref:Chalcone isomerase domain-containing protein n=1 Tax=Hevea brasiliensis TaxID=3981 RepID=A0ABQ9LJJ7_HEVBR|nr:hypothetical protein P3X46_019708 [Hevea brasiliensis]